MDEEQVDHYAQAFVINLDDLDSLEVDEWRLERIDEWGVVLAYERDATGDDIWETAHSYRIEDLLLEGADAPRLPEDGRMHRDPQYPVTRPTQAPMPPVSGRYFLWVDVDDEPGPGSDRAYIERNAIALVNNYGKGTIAPGRISGWVMPLRARRFGSRDSGTSTTSTSPTTRPFSTYWPVLSRRPSPCSRASSLPSNIESSVSG